ncbi:MAG: hypothetical protein ACRC8A_21365 [Microcoleaceae cyanobacterium]
MFIEFKVLLPEVFFPKVFFPEVFFPKVLLPQTLILTAIMLGAFEGSELTSTMLSPQNSTVSLLLTQPAQALETTAGFPIPQDAENLTKQPGVGVGESVNFQTKLSLIEAIEFYRKSLTGQGLKERELNTAITDATFSLVFEGAPNGLAVVVQGVNLGNKRNVNIRYEKLSSN